MKILCVMLPCGSFGRAISFQTGTAYVSAALKANKFDVTCLNLTYEIANDMHESIRVAMREKHIQCVMVGGYVTQWEKMHDVLSTAKQYKSDVITVMGGGGVTYSPVEMMELIPCADYGIIGEGELTSVNLVNALINNLPLSQVKGIVYREDSKVRITEEAPPIHNIDDLPMPDYEGFKLLELFDRHGSAGIVTSRGCPFSCTYCTRSGGKKYRVRGLDKVFLELDHIVKHANVKRVDFTDELFTVDKERLVQFCKLIKPYKLKWFISLRVDDNITVDDLRMMKDSGCELFQIGIESLDKDVLKSMDKRITLEQIETFLIKCKKAGVKTSAALIFGDPAENMNTLKNSVEWAKAHAGIINPLAVSPIVLLPGSKLFHDAVESGKINALEHIRNKGPLVNVSAMSDEEYSHLVTTLAPQLQKEILKHFNLAQNTSMLKIIDIDKNYLGISAQIKCGHCGEETEFFEDFYAHSYYGSLFSDRECANCKQCNPIDYSNFDFEVLKPAMEASFCEIFEQSDCDIVIWGLGNVYNAMRDFLNYIEQKYSTERVSFVLADTAEAGRVINNKKVSLPEDALKRAKYCIITPNFSFELKSHLITVNPYCVGLSFIELALYKTPLYDFITDAMNHQLRLAKHVKANKR